MPAVRTAINDGISILSRTKDPQLSDVSIDRAYFGELSTLSSELGREFISGYISLLIDIANLRTFVRSIRTHRNTDFLQASLHLCGFFPVQTTPQKWISQTPVGALEIHVFGSRHFCIIENDSLVAFLCTFLPHVFNGRISLTGPNEDLEVALPWLTRI